MALYQTILEDDFEIGDGSLSSHDISDAYIQRIASDIRLEAPLHVAVDCGNGVAGAFARRLMKGLVAKLQNFTARSMDLFRITIQILPISHNLIDLLALSASGTIDVGLAFDGDGDRLGVITRSGNIISRTGS